MFKIANAMGLDDSHIIQHVVAEKTVMPIHSELVPPLEAMVLAARQDGFELGLASTFRSFERQRVIWNAKADGGRPILAADEAPLDVATLSDDEKLAAIMHWSAIPGTSRHHWGSECDVYDALALKGKTLSLTVAETRTLFAPFYVWLEAYLVAHPEWVRPYTGTGPVAIEPWHLSYAPLAIKYQRLLEPQIVMQHLLVSELRLIDCVVKRWPEIYNNYVAAYFVE